MKPRLVLLALLVLLLTACGCDCPVPEPVQSTPALIVLRNDVLWDSDGCAYLYQTVKYDGLARTWQKIGERLPIADKGSLLCDKK